ncbi:Ger(x)C family spore germination protein [Paenibacillus ginsengarvi]|uniref:Ger(X)C family spore germination protein n=1 Tax=Paenibacillus ginsengarvi TaxID=400777 RepID=A0A3B0CIY1_9BACL|nr:Ger(x)C family spore germination protein [Paenibacillus ginsengarvi]RKN85343.1 Ger(x)C family spore germination protein [Paenibacillus ginsengarvi]
MRRMASLHLCLLLLALFLTGCWSRRELNDLGIAVGLSMDKTGDEYEISVQIVDPSEVSSKKGGASGRAPVTLYSAKGGTVAEAVRRLTGATPRRTYFSHIRIFLISEELAKGGIREALDFISRDHEFRTDFYIAIARGMPAKRLLGGMSHLEKIPASKIFDTLEVADKEWSPVVTVQLDDLLSSLAKQGKNSVLTSFHLEGDRVKGGTKEDIERVQPIAIVQIGELAVFKGDRLVGWLNETESRGYTDLTDKLKRTVIGVTCPKGGKLAVNIIRSDTRVSGRITGGKPAITVKSRAEADVSDVECSIDLTKIKTITELEKKVEAAIQSYSEASIKKAKSLKSDIFGFGEVFHRMETAYWNQVKDDWDRHFPDVQVELEVDVQIRRTGTIGNTVPNK